MKMQMQYTGNRGLHDVEFLRAYVLKAKDHKYLATPPVNDYLVQRQRGQLEGLAENLYRQNSRSGSNTSYGGTGTYDIASKLGLYNPTTSFSANLYGPKRKPYQNPSQKEEEKYI